MPTYEYRCPNGHDFEKFYRTISSSELEVACPQCGAVAHRRMSAGGGLVFKGSGFYLTDYGKNAHATRGGTRPSTSDSDTSKGQTSEGAAKPASDGNSPTPAPAADSSGGTSSAPKNPPKRDA